MKYVQQDWRGSVRAITNSNGFVTARTDHQAFGEEVGSGIGQRSIDQGYGTDKLTKQGYGLTETDNTSGQQHTWFRKLETQAGRWTAPDPYNGSMSLSDPQSFNKYSYVGNDPTNYVDPSGLLPVACFQFSVGDGVPGWACWGSSWDGLNLHDRPFPVDPGGVQTKQEQVYNDCANKAWGHDRSNAPGLTQALIIDHVAATARVSATSIAVTWRLEGGTTGSEFAMYPTNNGNDGRPGNVDIGPGQINFNTYSNSMALSGLDLNMVFGTNQQGGQNFNGDPDANIHAVAGVLESLGGNERNRVGHYRTGEGRFSRTRNGQSEFNKRVSGYDKLKSGYDRYFNCFSGGLR